MPRNHLRPYDMVRAVGTFESGIRQVNVAEALNSFQAVISRSIARYNSTGVVRKCHTVLHRITTSVQDRYIQLTARRNPPLTCNQLCFELIEAHNVQDCRKMILNRLHGVNLSSRRPWICQPLSRGNRGAR